MQPNLSYLDADDGALLQRVEPLATMRSASLRHVTSRGDGLVAIAAQWQRDPAMAPPLLALHRFGEPALRYLCAPAPEHRRLEGYGGSVAFSADGGRVAISSPRGERVQLFDAESGALKAAVAIGDVCGLAPSGDGAFATDGQGRAARIAGDGGLEPLAEHALAWDNHVAALSQA